MNKRWYIDLGPEGDVVVSSRIRLARNLSDFPFPCRLNLSQKRAVLEKVKSVFFDPYPEHKEAYDYISMENLSQLQAVSLAEKRLISPEFTAQREGRGLILKRDESVAIMLNEEDHTRIQVMCPGLQLQEAYRIADELDRKLERHLVFGFHTKLGYLTQCPTNIGTGMRASVMLHIPALQKQGQLSHLANNITKLGLTLRGAYGESSEGRGAFYQLSNQVTLGIAEEAAIENLRNITLQLAERERESRKILSENILFQDQLWRAKGILSNARQLSSEEFIGLVSDLKTGIALRYYDLDERAVNEALALVQPATLLTGAGGELSAQQRDILRAQIVREKLTKGNPKLRPKAQESPDSHDTPPPQPESGS